MQDCELGHQVASARTLRSQPHAKALSREAKVVANTIVDGQVVLGIIELLLGGFVVDRCRLGKFELTLEHSLAPVGLM